MKKQEAVKEIVICLGALDKLLRLSKINKKQVKLIKTRLDRDDVKSAYAFAVYKILYGIYNFELQSFREARSLVSEDLWDQYELLGFKGLREQDILNKSIKDFKAKWKTLPVFKKEKYVKKTQNKKTKR